MNLEQSLKLSARHPLPIPTTQKINRLKKFVLDAALWFVGLLAISFACSHFTPVNSLSLISTTATTFCVKNSTATARSGNVSEQHLPVEEVVPPGLLLLEASIQTPHTTQTRSLTTPHGTNNSVSHVNEDGVVAFGLRDERSETNFSERSTAGTKNGRFLESEGSSTNGLTAFDKNYFDEGETMIELLSSSTILAPNTTHAINNNLFHGHICLMLRDHPRCNYNFDGEDNVFFELQVQGQFKRVPQGPLYLGLEIPQLETFQVSWTVKTMLNGVIAFIKRWGYKSLHFSYGGNGELPHISSPVFQALDRVVITDAGQTPPKLGHSIPESYAETKRRKKFEFEHVIDPSAIYTMSFNNSYMNPVDWKLYGIPLFHTINLFFANVLQLSIYEVVEEDGMAVSPTGGDVQAISMGRHNRRNNVMWIRLRHRPEGK